MSGLLGRLADGREVKTFDNQRNAEQAGHMVLGGQRAQARPSVEDDVAMAMSHA